MEKFFYIFTIINTLLILLLFRNNKETFQKPNPSKQIILQDASGNISLMSLNSLYTSIEQAKNEAIQSANTHTNTVKNSLQSSLQSSINTKQPKGNYLIKGGEYTFGVRNETGKRYILDFWKRNPELKNHPDVPYWVLNGKVPDSECAKGNHRCVKIG